MRFRWRTWTLEAASVLTLAEEPPRLPLFGSRQLQSVESKDKQWNAASVHLGTIEGRYTVVPASTVCARINFNV